jgi:Tfp pilus assembly PilM family ATPase
LGISRKITALDIDADMLRVVQTIRRGRRIVVTRFAAEQLQFAEGADQNDPVVQGKAVEAALQRLRLRPGSVAMGVPRAQVILRTISIPPTTDFGEMASMVHFQIAKDLPFRPDEAVVDFKVHGPIPSASADAKGAAAAA